MDYKQTKLFLTIKEQVDNIDVYSLLEGGCPKDEFDEESKIIYQKIGKGMDDNQIATIMRNVFCEIFNDNFGLEIFIDSAKIIEKELNK